MNSQGTDKRTPRGIDGNWPDVPAALPRNIPPLKEAAVQTPTDMIAFGDVTLFKGTSVDDRPGLEPLLGSFNFPFYQSNLNGKIRAQALPYEYQRHQGLFNVVFCDAHVEAINVARLFGVRPDLTQRWNRDHLPHTEAWD
jgi:prepilin-type processing-associated H-X9-DG protein